MRVINRLAFALTGVILIFSTFFFPSAEVDSRMSSYDSTLTPPDQAIGQVINSEYVVFAWNNLGMHCANPSYDVAVLLPPYNTLWAQVVKRGNPPQIVTQNLSVDYRFINNTYSYGKRDYGQFWDNSQALFGLNLPKNTGLNLSNPGLHNGLSGPMATITDHFEAEGVPISPIDDANTWDPYQIAEITVRDGNGNIKAQTRATAPISDEINCAKCHGSDAFNDILKKHDQLSATTLQNEKPVLCARCHGDPALGSPQVQPVKYLSQSIHGFHGQLASPPSCYDCHPGQITRCSRSIAHTSSDGNCTTCHGDLNNMAGTITQGRMPWGSEPKCVTCHTGVAQVDTGSALYRNSAGHSGIYCASCHSSPHAMVPSSKASDNYQAIQYQGKAVPIGDCAACHVNSKGGGEGGLGDYLETHGGSNPEEPNTCYVCHTSVNTINTAKWPHSFQWRMLTGNSPTITLTSSLNPSSLGQSVTFTASVSVTGSPQGTPSGTVIFQDGLTTLESVPLNSSGQASFTTSTLSAGWHNIIANYSGDFNFTGGNSNTLNQSVGNLTTTILTSDLNPSLIGQPVTFTASVIVSEQPTDAPSGTIIFRDETASLGSVPLNSSGQASFTTSTLSAGLHNITAHYSGDSIYPASVSYTLNQLVKISLNLTPDTLDNGDAGVSYTELLQVFNGVSPYTWSINKLTKLPNGLKLKANKISDSALITGKPLKAGTFNFKVIVKDKNGAVIEKELSIIINPAVKISLPAPLPVGDPGVAYSTLPPTASGGTGPGTYIWSITPKKPLPPGLTLNPVNGVISGLPGASGSFAFTLTVKDGLGSSASKYLTIMINKTLVITTTSLPAAKVGTTYSKSLKATGGSRKYTWSLAAGSAALPAWVDMNKFTTRGIIASLSGSKPVAGGPYNLKFMVSDTLGGIAESGVLVLAVK
jgi:hypothetical protein